MTKFKDKYRVESARLRGWDYASAGWYFVTLCTRNRECVLSEVVNGVVHLSPIGELVAREWLKTEQVRANVALDECVIMPNHVHGIIVIKDNLDVETARRAVSTRDVSTRAASTLKPSSLGSIIGQIKSNCTKHIWAAGFTDFNWQARFYDHIVRNERSLNAIREYIIKNPLKWEQDKDNIEGLRM